jgi:hypothetical protein
MALEGFVARETWTKPNAVDSFGWFGRVVEVKCPGSGPKQEERDQVARCPLHSSGWNDHPRRSNGQVERARRTLKPSLAGLYSRGEIVSIRTDRLERALRPPKRRTGDRRAMAVGRGTYRRAPLIYLESLP